MAGTGGNQRSSGPAARLHAVLALTFLNSLGTGVVTNGIFFLAAEQFGFGRLSNYGLAVLLGAGSALGSATIARVVTRWQARGRSLRAAAGTIQALLGVACLMPLLLDRLGAGGAWTIWALISLYGLGAGSLWPIIESYLSGGRSAAALRRATGRFNLTWAFALVLAFWAMSPLVGRANLLAIAVLGAAHLVAAGVSRTLPRFPGRHAPGDPTAAADPRYAPLLTLFRVQLLASYFVLSALSPLLPRLLSELGLDPSAATRLATTWMTARFGAFLVMERWHGWRGRQGTCLVGGALMLGGFGMCVLAPLVAERNAGLALMSAGLGCFGAGIGIIYSAAIYYALALGQAEVHAGGRHETLIGTGYTLGPIVGLAAAGAARADWLGEAGFLWTILGTVGAGAAAGGLGSLLWGARRTRQRRSHSEQQEPDRSGVRYNP